MTEKLQGVFPPMVTPFSEDNTLDLNRVKKVASFLSNHVHGLFICGTYGVFALLSDDERKAVCEVVLETVNGKVPVIVHVGATHTASAVELAVHAAKSGAIAVASVPPHYYTHEEESVLSYFKDLVDAVSIPVYLYNNPKTVGYSISPAFLAKIKEEAGISGVKDSSFDALIFFDYIRLCGDDFDTVLGTGSMFMAVELLGAKAFIPGTGNALPELMVEFWNKAINREYPAAQKLQLLVLSIREIMKKAGPSHVVVQEIMKARGIDAGFPRRPFKPLSEQKREQLLTALQDLGISFGESGIQR